MSIGGHLWCPDELGNCSSWSHRLAVARPSGLRPTLRPVDEHLQRVLADDWLGDVTTLDMAELRARRAECQALEVALSYRRRMAQGRLDIVGAEQRRRRGEAPAGEADDLVATLTAALSEHPRPPGTGRLPQLLAPDIEEVDTAELDTIAGPTSLVALAELSDDQVASLIAELSAYEHRVSAERRQLHERIDALQAEITRRYRTGEASVETLLQ